MQKNYFFHFVEKKVQNHIDLRGYNMMLLYFLRANVWPLFSLIVFIKQTTGILFLYNIAKSTKAHFTQSAQCGLRVREWIQSLSYLQPLLSTTSGGCYMDASVLAFSFDLHADEIVPTFTAFSLHIPTCWILVASNCWKFNLKLQTNEKNNVIRIPKQVYCFDKILWKFTSKKKHRRRSVSIF